MSSSKQIQEIADVKDASKSLESNTTVLMEKSQLIQDDMKKLERYSRKFNLRFIGVQVQQRDAGQEDCVMIIGDLIKDLLGFNADIENAHRTGKQVEGKPRHIIAKFIRRPDRFKVLKLKHLFKDKNITVSEDLVFEDLQMRRKLIPFATEAYTQGKKVRFVNGCDLFIDGKLFKLPTWLSEQY